MDKARSQPHEPLVHSGRAFRARPCETADNLPFRACPLYRRGPVFPIHGATLEGRQPLVDAPRLAAELSVTPANTRKALERLEANGVVLSAQVAKNHRAWRAPDILDLLDEFAEKAGRRETPAG